MGLSFPARLRSHMSTYTYTYMHTHKARARGLLSLSLSRSPSRPPSHRVECLVFETPRPPAIPGPDRAMRWCDLLWFGEGWGEVPLGSLVQVVPTPPLQSTNYTLTSGTGAGKGEMGGGHSGGSIDLMPRRRRSCADGAAVGC
jgi:hypothetical protein